MAGNIPGFDTSSVTSKNFFGTPANYTNNDVGDDDLTKKNKKDANGMSGHFDYSKTVFNFHADPTKAQGCGHFG